MHLSLKSFRSDAQFFASGHSHSVVRQLRFSAGRAGLGDHPDSPPLTNTTVRVPFIKSYFLTVFSTAPVPAALCLIAYLDFLILAKSVVSFLHLQHDIALQVFTSSAGHNRRFSFEQHPEAIAPACSSK